MLSLEERLNKLEQDNQMILNLLSQLKKEERYVTPDTLASVLNCSKNHIYIQIRKGTIHAINIGSSYRIPMSQFDTLGKAQEKISLSERNGQHVPTNNKFSIKNIKTYVFSS